VAVADDVPAWIAVDRLKVRQIIQNLVANAIKFTEAGFVAATVALETPAGDADPVLIVAVADSGIGIPPEKAEAIFEAFVQGDESISRTHGGSGLGLAISRQLAHVMGGSLTYEARPGGGSVFTLRVPCRVVDAADVSPSPRTAPAASRPGVRVLLAEDNEVNRAMGARLLARLEADVVTASDGSEAADLAAKDAFDLVLMDLQMPRVDGIQAARIIRAFEEANGRTQVPIVALTGNDPGDYGEACAAAGMNGFLVKPVGLAELSRVLAGVGSPGQP
jgi:CheY-like chemotaxis protein